MTTTTTTTNGTEVEITDRAGCLLDLLPGDSAGKRFAASVRIDGHIRLMPDCDTIAEAIAHAELYLSPADMGSLDPIDVGFDLRATKTPIKVPYSAAVTVRLPRSGRHPNGKVLAGDSHAVAASLNLHGFATAGTQS